MDLLDLKKDERGKQRKIRNWGEYNDGLVERGSLQVYLTEEVGSPANSGVAFNMLQT